MAQIVKNIKDNIKKIINELSGSSIEDDELEETTDPILLNAQENADNIGKNTEEPMVSESSKSSKNGGFSNGLKKDTLDKMRKQLQEVRVEEIITEKDKEERDR